MTVDATDGDVAPPMILDGLADKLKALLPDLEGAGPHGTLKGGESEGSVMTMPWWDQAPHLLALRCAFGEHRVWFSFDWPTWAQTDEAMLLLRSCDAIAVADLLTIRRLVTVHLRKERFCEGHLVAVTECGQMAAIVRRMIELLS